MSDYTPTTDFSIKDSLPTGDSGKVIKGSDFDVEFENIETAIQTKYDSTTLGAATGSSLVGYNLGATGATNTTVQTKLREAINLKSDFGATGDGVTDDTTAYTNWITAVKANDVVGVVPKGNYLVSGTVYNVTSDFVYMDDGLVANIGLGEAETKLMLLTGKTPDAGGARITSDDRTLLGITLDITGAQHGNAARFNVFDYSSCIDGSTCLYLHSVSNADTLWLAGNHSEIRHGTTGTTICANNECQSFIDDGTFIGLNVQYTNYTGAVHPITSDPAVQHSNGVAMRVAGTTDDGLWKHGLNITQNSILSTGSSIKIDADATSGIHVTDAVVNSGADIFLEADSANGLVCAGTYTSGNAIRTNAGQAISLEASGSHKILAGTGSPEGVVTASIGSLYCRTDGGAGTSLYVKQSGAGNTGWVGK